MLALYGTGGPLLSYPYCHSLLIFHSFFHLSPFTLLPSPHFSIPFFLFFPRHFFSTCQWYLLCNACSLTATTTLTSLRATELKQGSKEHGASRASFQIWGVPFLNQHSLGETEAEASPPSGVGLRQLSEIQQGQVKGHFSSVLNKCILLAYFYVLKTNVNGLTYLLVNILFSVQFEQTKGI